MFTTLIATDSLADHLFDPDWVVVDCRFDLRDTDWGAREYAAAHVPGAVYAHLDRDLSGAKTGRNGRHPLPSVEQLAATFGGWGIASDGQVVAYDQDTGMYASRLWWLLRYLGHDAAAVLDGGFAKWTHEGRPARGGDERREARVFSAAPRDNMRVDAERVARMVADQSCRLVDARAPERYEGVDEPIDRVGGHIPGAGNRYFKDNLSAAGTFLPPGELRECWRAVLGGVRPEQVVSYCGSGVTACHNLLALEHAGLRGARLYAGSWSEWSSDPARPIEKGRSPT